MKNSKNYGPGDYIMYRTFTGDVRTVWVRTRFSDVKNGKPGFTGTEVHPVTFRRTGLFDDVWGYDAEIVSVL